MSEFREAARALSAEIAVLQVSVVCRELTPISKTLATIARSAYIRNLGAEAIMGIANFTADERSKAIAEIGTKIEEFAKKYESELAALANRQKPSPEVGLTR